jgi:hypothetical protein
MAHFLLPCTILDQATTLCIQDALDGRGYRDLYEYVADVCKVGDPAEMLNPTELTYYVYYALDTIAQVRQFTTLHPTHLLFIKRRLSLELDRMMLLYHNSRLKELTETILQTVLGIITQLLAKVVGLDINEMHAVIEDCKGNPSPPFINIINIDIVNKTRW